jgi:hypothetical protein
MAVAINKAYIENLAHTPSKSLQPVRAKPFLKALEAAYGHDKSKTAMQWLLEEKQQNSFSGMKSFQERIIIATCDNGKISVDDQKYINDIAFRFFTNRMQPVNLNQ